MLWAVAQLQFLGKISPHRPPAHPDPVSCTFFLASWAVCALSVSLLGYPLVRGPHVGLGYLGHSGAQE